MALLYRQRAQLSITPGSFGFHRIGYAVPHEASATRIKKIFTKELPPPDTIRQPDPAGTNDQYLIVINYQRTLKRPTLYIGSLMPFLTLYISVFPSDEIP